MAERNTTTNTYAAHPHSNATVDVPLDSWVSSNLNYQSPSTTTTPGFLTRDPIVLPSSQGFLPVFAMTLGNQYQYVYSRSLIYMDPSGLLFDDGDDDSPYTGPLQDLIDEIKDTPLDDLTGPGGLPIKPDDLIGAGGDVIDALIDVIVNAGTPGSPCNQLFSNLVRGTICGAANCDPKKCPEPPPQTQGPAGPFNDCLDIATKDIPHLRPLFEQKFRKIIEDAIDRCRKAAQNGPCCKDGKPLPRHLCAPNPPPFQPVESNCERIRKACNTPRVPPGKVPRVPKFPKPLR